MAAPDKKKDQKDDKNKKGGSGPDSKKGAGKTAPKKSPSKK